MHEPISALPMGVFINGVTGAVDPASGHYVKRLSELREIYQDKVAFDHAVKERDDPVTYEVVEYRPENSDIYFGTTTVIWVKSIIPSRGRAFCCSNRVMAKPVPSR